ncbi:MAG: sigma-70 family RNA polymerase sigma factor [bacterium]
MPDTKNEVTLLLHRVTDGDIEAMSDLLPLVYNQLRDLASDYMRYERKGHTLQSTALVHEAYLRLIDQNSVDWQNRAHFFGVAAQAMRRILLDYARKYKTGKRGGGQQKVSLTEAGEIPEAHIEEVLALSEALDKLGVLDERQAKIVELRYFAGLKIDETAEAMGISPALVKKEWSMAKAWLIREMRQ